MRDSLITLKLLVVVFSLTLGLIGTGCKSKKLSVLDASGLLKAKSHNEVLDDVLAHELDYKTLTTKGKVSLNGKEVTAIFKLVKDEIIQASIRPMLGIEAVRMDITPEKIVVIDRMGKKYAEVDISDSEFGALVAFNFYNLQALLTNKLFLAGGKNVGVSDYDQFDISTKDNHFVLQTEDRNSLQYKFAVDASDRIVSTMVAYPSKEMAFVWGYDEFVEDGEHIYPTSMLGQMKVKKKNIRVGVKYSDLDINTEFNVDQSIPSRYAKIEILDLLGAYMKIK